MYLKQLTLKGFKSFADKTVLGFEHGVNVVVGPNGSGKSNLVDAVAWVLGAQGARALRGGKMDDVIFAGTPSRAPLGRAEVDLVIDNSSGLLPVDFSEVRITRTLFRSGESDYQLNGTSVRLADIQEILSDSGVGRTQHVIVGQGQLDTILNSRPEDRRSVVEEAAGILKYRRRKERAERRLESTEANLIRLTDLLREVRRQLRPLERQAEAARIHDGLVADLATVRRYLIGLEFQARQATLAEVAVTDATLGARDAELRSELATHDRVLLERETELGARRDDDHAEMVARVDSLRERLRGLQALATEKRRGVERALAAAADESVAASLTDEAGRIRAQLEAVSEEAQKLGPMADDVAAADRRVVHLERSLPEEPGNDPSDGGHSSAAITDRAPGAPSVSSVSSAALRAELATRRASSERARHERTRIEERLAQQRRRASELDIEAGRRRAEASAAHAAEPALVTASERAEIARIEAEATAESAEESLRSAQAAEQRWRARFDALSLALDEARAAAGAERLAQLDGVVGPLVDLIEVDPGQEAAIAAGLGEALRAVVVSGVATARAAVRQVHADGGQALLLVLDRAATGDAQPLPLVPEGVRPLTALVRGRVLGLDALLDRLLRDVVVVGDGPGAPDPIDLAMSRPELSVVTAAGDWFRSGAPWRAGGGGGTAVTRAALDEADAELARAVEALTRARHHVETARQAMRAARADDVARGDALDLNDEKLQQALHALERLEEQRASITAQEAAFTGQLRELEERLGPDEARVAELLAAIPQAELVETDRDRRRNEFRLARRELDQQVQAAAALRHDLEVRAAGVEERRALLKRRLAEVGERLDRLGEQSLQSQQRRQALTDGLERYDRIAAKLAAAHAAVASVHEQVHSRRRQHIDAVRTLTAAVEHVRHERAGVEQALAAISERRRLREVEAIETRMRLEALVETARREFGLAPDEMVAAPRPEVAEGVDLVERERELDRQLRRIGPVNPLALEEFTSIKERSEFLDQQLEDVRESRRELTKVIQAVDREIAQLFASAFTDVARHFEELFVTLFPGGAGRLSLTDPDDLLNTGIEIEARPSGKNVRRLSLLSGGERSLTALGYLFAVYRARPSPFYLLDEVDAALDDVNLGRFVDLVNVFRRDAQLLIVSHQKRTMEAADFLHGVSMAPGGSTKLVSQAVEHSV